MRLTKWLLKSIRYTLPYNQLLDLVSKILLPETVKRQYNSTYAEVIADVSFVELDLFPQIHIYMYNGNMKILQALYMWAIAKIILLIKNFEDKFSSHVGMELSLTQYYGDLFVLWFTSQSTIFQSCWDRAITSLVLTSAVGS